MKRKADKFITPHKRQAALTEGRNLKIARSAHAYVRGNTENFYEWLASDSSATLPKGPAVWICGDCHVSNLGPIANAKGRIARENVGAQNFVLDTWNCLLAF